MAVYDEIHDAYLPNQSEPNQTKNKKINLLYYIIWRQLARFFPFALCSKKKPKGKYIKYLCLHEVQDTENKNKTDWMLKWYKYVIQT